MMGIVGWYIDPLSVVRRGYAVVEAVLLVLRLVKVVVWLCM